MAKETVADTIRKLRTQRQMLAANFGEQGKTMFDRAVLDELRESPQTKGEKPQKQEPFSVYDLI